MASKASSQRNERTLNDLRTQVEGNNNCADCNATQPRWASWSLGIFLCVRCATVHRKMGSQVSKVKSLTLDTWTREQVDSMRATGNARSNAFYNPDPRRHPPPLDLESEDRESAMERYIMQKYQKKAFVRKEQEEREAQPDESRLKELRALRQAVSLPSPVSSQDKGRPSPPPSATLPNAHSRAEESALRPPPARAATANPYLGAADVSRPYTSPLPELPRSSTSAAVANPVFQMPNRQMTASAQIPSTSFAATPPPVPTSSSMPPPFRPGSYPRTGLAPPVTSGSTGMTSSGMVGSLGQPSGISSQGSFMPMQWPVQTQQPTGAIWNDLAGLSLGSGAASGTSSYSSSSSSSIGTPSFQSAGASPLLHTSTANSNPFLRASPSYSMPGQSHSPAGFSTSNISSPSTTPFTSPAYSMPQQQAPPQPSLSSIQTRLSVSPGGSNPYLQNHSFQDNINRNPYTQTPPLQQFSPQNTFSASNPYSSSGFSQSNPYFQQQQYQQKSQFANQYQ